MFDFKNGYAYCEAINRAEGEKKLDKEAVRKELFRSRQAIRVYVYTRENAQKERGKGAT